MTRAEVVFIGLARDCADTLPRLRSFIADLAEVVTVTAVVIGENGSTDQTATLLDDYADKDPLWHRVDTAAMALEPSRLRRMARGREVVKQAAARWTTPSSIVCVLDIDNVLLEPPSKTAFVAAIEKLRADEQLFAVASSSTPRFYDLLSLEMAGFDFSDLNARIVAAKANPLTFPKFMSKNVWDIQDDPRLAAPFRCESAFNGLCLYRAADYAKASYLYEGGQEICEHIVLNRLIRAERGGQCLVDGDLVIRAPEEHVRRSTWQIIRRVLLRKLGRLTGR